MTIVELTAGQWEAVKASPTFRSLAARVTLGEPAVDEVTGAVRFDDWRWTEDERNLLAIVAERPSALNAGPPGRVETPEQARARLFARFAAEVAARRKPPPPEGG